MRRRVVLYRGFLPCDILFLGEAPGACITGDTCVEVAYRNKVEYPDGIPIKDLVGKSGFKVYSYSTKRKKLVLGTVKKVWCTGARQCYKVKYFWWGAPGDGKGGRKKYYGEIKVTSNHPFLLKNGTYLSIDKGLSVGTSLQPFYRHGKKYPHVGTHHLSMQKESRLLLSNKIGRKLKHEEQAHHDDRNKWNDSWDNLMLLDIVEHARLHGIEDNTMRNPKSRAKHKKAMTNPEYRAGQSKMMSDHLADPENRRRRIAQIHAQRDQTSATVKALHDDPAYKYRYWKGRQKLNNSKLTDKEIEKRFREKFPSEQFPPVEDNHEIISIEKCGKFLVYDMEVEQYHNFATNGIFVHNSEDVLGKPFAGPAGLLLDSIINSVMGTDDWTKDPSYNNSQIRIGMTNLIACIPKEIIYDEENPDEFSVGNKIAEPAKMHVDACSERLQEIYSLAKPKKVVCVGKLAEKYIGKILDVSIEDTIEITHPAAILRADISAQGLAMQRVRVQLEDLFDELMEEKSNV